MKVVLLLVCNIIIIFLTMNSTFQNQTLMVVKFQPNDIVLMDKFTRKLYSYNQQSRNINLQSDHQIVLKCQTLCTGLLYQKQLTTLGKIIGHKISNPLKQYYQEEQLNNTFQPILSSLQNGLKHGAISLENILIDVNGNIRLRDPRISQQQYEQNNDFQRLGLIILQCALLKDKFQMVQKQYTKINLVSLLTIYSEKFIANLWILLNCVKNLIPQINLSQNQSQEGKYKQLIKQISELKYKNKKEQKINIEVLKSLQQKQQKKIIVIPSLNLKMVKERERTRVGYSAKKPVVSNQNMNMENIRSTKIGQKTINFKCLNKNKKLQIMDNCKNILKKKGKTLDKKIK